MSVILSDAMSQIFKWIEMEGFKGWDPYDALNSPLLHRLTFGSRRLGQLWVQALKNSPVNFRPFLGISKGFNPKAIGLFMASYWRKYLLTRDDEYLKRVQFFTDWLQTNSSTGYHGNCWGYNFPWPNRGFFAPKNTPTIVNTAIISLTFLDLLNLPSSLDQRQSWGDMPLRIARSACDFILQDLNHLSPTPDELCFSYTPLDQRYVHNANLLGAILLAETAAHTQETELVETALASVRYTARRQRPDGSWLYGEDRMDSWVDNFHTGFVLSAFKRIGMALGTEEFHAVSSRGYTFWKENFFRVDGAPKYYAGKTYPIDAHAVAQSILTFLSFADEDPNARDLAHRTAAWGIANLQSPEGYFYFRLYPFYTIKIPYMRWSQAWMQRALVELQWSGSDENLD